MYSQFQEYCTHSFTGGKHSVVQCSTPSHRVFLPSVTWTLYVQHSPMLELGQALSRSRFIPISFLGTAPGILVGCVQVSEKFSVYSVKWMSCWIFFCEEKKEHSGIKILFCRVWHAQIYLGQGHSISLNMKSWSFFSHKLNFFF